jgi:membrane fusion protein, multidrug efflux system
MSFKLNKNSKIALILTSVVVFWMVSGVFKSEEKKETIKEIKKVNVLAKNIIPEMYTPTVEIIGRTAVADEVDLVAEVSGKVESIKFEQGDYVKAGDLMLTLENNYRKDNLDAAQEELISSKLKLDIAKDLAKQAYKAKTDLADRQSEYSRAFSDLTEAKRNYENSFVHSPISGFVEEKNVSLGDYVNNDTVLYKIISQDKMYLVGYLSQNQINKVTLGQKAYGILNSNEKVEGIVSFISQKADESTKTYKIEVTINLESANARVREGLTVKIFIPSEKVAVYKISHSSMVINDNGKVGIRYVDANNTVQFLETTLVEDTNQYQLLQTGTKKPLNLIVRGQVDVKAGIDVDVSFSDDIAVKNEEK